MSEPGTKLWRTDMQQFERWWTREVNAGIGIRDERDLGAVKAVARAA
jgi:hypothetical protein